MTTQTIDATLFASAHTDIAKRTSVSKLLISLAMILAGLVVFISVFRQEDASSTVSMALMVLGTALLLFGVFRLFWKSKVLVYLPTGSTTSVSSLYFDQGQLKTLTDMVERGALNGNAGIKREASGNVRLDVMASQDGKFAAVQLFQFVPYTYTAVTSVKYFTGEGAASVADFLAKCK
ncbi:MAG: hypothetical protein Q4D56_06905 [Bacteroides sp.]|nr:hypothetical protein [Bacteroides sp.]